MFNTLTADELVHVVGGEDATAVAKRAADHKAGHGSMDLYGYNERTGTSTRTGIGTEIRQRVSPNVSLFGRGQVGTKDDKPETSVMGGIRVEW